MDLEDLTIIMKLFLDIKKVEHEEQMKTPHFRFFNPSDN